MKLLHAHVIGGVRLLKPDTIRKPHAPIFKGSLGFFMGFSDPLYQAKRLKNQGGLGLT